MLVPPSPKLQSQDVGLPVDVSVNWTDWPAIGEEGLNVKDATREPEDATTTVRLELLDSLPFATVRVTLYDPEAE